MQTKRRRASLSRRAFNAGVGRFSVDRRSTDVFYLKRFARPGISPSRRPVRAPVFNVPGKTFVFSRPFLSASFPSCEPGKISAIFSSDPTDFNDSSKKRDFPPRRASERRFSPATLAPPPFASVPAPATLAQPPFSRFPPPRRLPGRRVSRFPPGPLFPVSRPPVFGVKLAVVPPF